MAVILRNSSFLCSRFCLGYGAFPLLCPAPNQAMNDHDNSSSHNRPSEGVDDTQRRALRIAELEQQSGIDQAMIERLVRGFYERIQQDALLGPIFAAKITDWEPHLQRMFAFWSSVTLATGSYSGQPMAKHMHLPIDARHFDRWLSLFNRTARELCPPTAAEVFMERAHRIAMSLEMGRAYAHGKIMGRDTRFIDPSLQVESA